MKRVKKRNLRREREGAEVDFEVKRAILFKILIAAIIILMVLTLTYILVYESGPEEKTMEGELGTLCIFCSDNPVVLTVLNYSLSPDNFTLHVNINWSAGNVSSSDFNSIFLTLNMRAGNKCNYTITNSLPNFGSSFLYVIVITSFRPNCTETDFSNLTSVSAYAEVNIHLIQTGSIPNINFYKDDSRNNLVYLNNYFRALTEINYSVVESPDNSQIEVSINNATKNLSISVLDSTWFGTQTFNITATEGGDSIATSFNIVVLNETRPVVNNAPVFDDTECGRFSWYENRNKTIDMDDCWSDADGDNLEYTYSSLNNYQENISIINLTGNRLTFAPDPDFNGSTYLTFYANDSKVRISHRVDLIILGNLTNTTQNTSTPYTPATPISNLQIISANPAGTRASFFVNETKRFSILAENYEDIEWYVGGTLVKEGGLYYVFEETRPGIYAVKARIINGTAIQEKVWEVTIEESEPTEDGVVDINIGKVIFYSIIAIIIIIIILILWLIILERKKRRKKTDLGFGVSVVPNRWGANESSKQFNIPKD